MKGDVGVGGKQVWGAREGRAYLAMKRQSRPGWSGQPTAYRLRPSLSRKSPPHHGVDTPAPAQGQEVEVVEVGSDGGDAWGRSVALSRGTATASTTAHILTIRNQSLH